MSLRDMIIDMRLNTDSSPLLDLNREMNQVIRGTENFNSGLNRMDRQLRRSNRGIIQETEALNDHVSRQSDLIRQLSSDMGTSAVHLASDWQDMSKDMRKSLIQNHNQMVGHRKDLLNVQNDMRKLGNQMGHYSGSTNDFMKEITELGKRNKKVTDAMINNNLSMRQGLIQTIATMSAMSSQSEKIAKNYDRMGGAFLGVNKPLLHVTSGLDRIARNGNAAQLSLEMLGPNANMKALQDMTALITAGVMRQQGAVIALGVAWLGFTAIMANASYGADPNAVRAQEAQVTTEYKNAWQDRVTAIRGFVNIFQKVSVPKVKPAEMMKAMQSQLDAMLLWRKSMQSLTKKGVDEGLLAELRKAGPAAAGQIRALDKMSKPQLDKYVSTWRSSMGLARASATDELAKMRQETAKKIKEIRETLNPLGVAWDKLKNKWTEAAAPFVDIWGKIASKVVDGAGVIIDLINKLNDISPWITKIAGMFIYVAVSAALLLTPMAAGIGYINGMRLAFSTLWTAIGPAATGLGAFVGTALLVAGIVVVVAAAFYLLWKHCETFRKGVIWAWTQIKTAAIAVWEYLKPYIMDAIKAVTGFVSEKLNQLKSFWHSNGSGIMDIVKFYFGFIWGYIKFVAGMIFGIFKTVWPLIVGIVKVAWAFMKLIINNALTIIGGVIKVGVALIHGDWKGAWTAIKDTAKNIVGNIMKFFKGLDFKKIGKDMIQGMINGINSMAGTLSKAVNAITGGINKVLNAFGIKAQIPEWHPTIIGGSAGTVSKSKMATGGVSMASYARGTNFHPGGPAIVGEAGRELIHANGKTFLANKQMMLNLPRGASVLPNKQTEQLLAGGMPGYASGVGDFFKNIWNYVSEPTSLVTKLFDKIGIPSFPDVGGALGNLGKGALDLLKKSATSFVKGKLPDFSLGGGNAPATVKKWIMQAMVATGTPGTWLGPLTRLAMKESGGNPRAINLWDSNAKAGHPSKGLMQTIDSTFGAYKMSGHGDIWNPVDNAIASIRYMKSRYGSVFNTPGMRSMAKGGGYKGYATGGVATKPQWATLAENGWKEFIIPTEPRMRKRAIPLLKQANKELGVSADPASGETKNNLYKPSLGGPSTSKTVQIDFNPTYEINIEGNGKLENIKQQVKDAVKELTNDQYQALLALLGTEVVR
ncbi:transglycosylase SLT domain-containing protein [Peribacillus sp. B-H-3]|uniref:transglycosylase SLT domain-containing protein n=1 Tax=Peribacillus sp. B-H-3 TaxID=3400420 RepID=UPI003B026FE1